MKRKRSLDAYLDEKTKQFEDAMRLAYPDRMKFLRNQWTESFYRSDSNPNDDLRLSVATQSDVSVHNAVDRVNFADQKPTQDQIVDLQKKSFETACDRFKEITERIDEIAGVLKQLDNAIPSAFKMLTHSQYLADLSNGTYDRERDVQLISSVYEVDDLKNNTTDPAAAPATDQISAAPAASAAPDAVPAAAPVADPISAAPAASVASDAVPAAAPAAAPVADPISAAPAASDPVPAAAAVASVETVVSA